MSTMPESTMPEEKPAPKLECMLRDTGVLTLTMNRPDKLNALDDELSADIIKALRQAERDPQIRCILITGAGRGFCAGQDLQSRSMQQENGTTPSLGESIRNRYLPLIHKLRTIEKPVVAAINGVAAGAGASIAFACDYRVASYQASFIQSFIKIGLIPDSGACYLLPRIIGLGRAMDIMLSGRKVSAEEAFSIGLINQICARHDLMTKAYAFCDEMAAGPTKAYGLLKRGINKALDSDLEQYLYYEAELQEIAGRTKDFKEGVAAFIEKRPPVFCGE